MCPRLFTHHCVLIRIAFRLPPNLIRLLAIWKFSRHVLVLRRLLPDGVHVLRRVLPDSLRVASCFSRRTALNRGQSYATENKSKHTSMPVMTRIETAPSPCGMGLPHCLRFVTQTWPEVRASSTAQSVPLAAIAMRYALLHIRICIGIHTSVQMLAKFRF